MLHGGVPSDMLVEAAVDLASRLIAEAVREARALRRIHPLGLPAATGHR